MINAETVRHLIKTIGANSPNLAGYVVSLILVCMLVFTFSSPYMWHVCVCMCVTVCAVYAQEKGL